MLFYVPCVLLAVQVLSDVPPASPQDVHVDNWQLTWRLTPEEGNVTYTVEYSSDVWKSVQACANISSNSCDVISTNAAGEHQCVILRVRAERRGLTSTPVKACSPHGNLCSPDFRLTAGPDSLTVHLSRNHRLPLELGENLKHCVYYGKEGEPLQYADVLSSVTIPDLQKGQRYCAEVQYIYISRPVGAATCSLCEVIPVSRKYSKQSNLIFAVVLPVVVLLVLVPVIAYLVIFQRRRIKRWLRPPYRIPDDFFEPFGENYIPISSSSHSEEHCHGISAIYPEEFRE
ncbi:interferon gamma receptor 2 isoform 2-T2 [Spinachia spinachia]